MTTATPAEATRARPASGNRVMNVLRLQLINTQSLVWVPLLILVAAVVISVLIFAMIPGDGIKVAGAANAPLWYFMALGVQSLTLAFPFAQAMSVTRREFLLGTLVFGVIAAALMATLFILLAGVELLTDGYGMNGRVAHLDWLFEPGWISAWLSYFMFTLLLFVIGFWAATIWKRFGTLAIVSVGIVLGLALALSLLLITRTDSWPAVIGWFVDTGAFVLTLLGLALTGVAAVGTYLTLRRATV